MNAAAIDCDHCGSTGEDRYRHPGLQTIAGERGSDSRGETTERETELGSDRHPGHAHLGRELLVVQRERRSARNRSSRSRPSKCW